MTDDKTYKEISERMQADAFARDCHLSVLCEDIYDNGFWRCIIEDAEPSLKDKLDFPNPNPKGTRGKDVLKKLKNYVNKKMIICVDSDCEYLYDNNVWYINRYIYHTIVHSRENFQCNHLSLNEICKEIADKSYDFRTLFEDISERISIIFYIWVHLKETGSYPHFNGIINNEQFRKILDFQGIQYNSLEDKINLYQAIEDRVNHVLNNLEKLMDNEVWYQSVIEYEVPQLRTKLIEQYEIHPKETLSFFYGHGVLENLVEPLTIKITDLLKKLRIEEVRQELSQASEKDRSNTIRSIENTSRQDVKTKIGDSFKYTIYIKYKYIKEIQQKLMSELSCDGETEIMPGKHD